MLGLSSAGLLCWMVMFLAGTDIWHDTGRPDLRALPGATAADIRAFAYAFYLLPLILVAHLVVTATRVRRTIKPEA